MMTQTYKLYTDASRRRHDGEMLCVIAGCLLDTNNHPILEFIVKTQPLGNTEYLEMLALQTGLEEAKRAGVKNIMCFVDNLNTVKIIKRLLVSGETEEKQKGWQNYIEQFSSFQIEHLPREYNLYANALSKVPFNLLIKKDSKLAYHGVNRSKHRFYEKLQQGISKDVHDYDAKNKESVYIKFTNTRDALERLSQQSEKTELDLLRINKLFKQFYTHFHTVLYSRQNAQVKQEHPKAFHDFLHTTEIDAQYWPEWLAQRPTLKKRI